MATPAASTSAKSLTAAPPKVIRSLYRSVMREAVKLDKLPVTKALLPMPKRLQLAAGLTAQLHMPTGISFADVARKLFRDPKAALPVKVGFDALQTLRLHLSTVSEEMPRITRDHKALLTVLDSSAVDKSKYWARPVPVPREAGALLKVPLPDGSESPSGEVQLSTAATMALLRRAGFDLKVGMGLIAHPLSSAHADRRVMLIVEKNMATTTALVLDMLYSYPLSHGNPMFPEVLWGHEVHNGGYCHVDFTMPPTANVSVLHSLEPPQPETPSYSRWLQWSKRQSPTAKSDPEAIRAQHEACCQPVIRGTDGQPTLYYSKVEALPYLSTLAQGQPRECLRVYWGCMKWSTPQLITEVASGHWMPVEVSSSFFGAYAVRPPHAPTATPDDAALLRDPIERFPSEDILKEAKAQRERHLGANITPPQVFPPTQPMCRREALWDQIMHSLGGEYRQLVGCVNPFASPRGEFSRVPPMGAVDDLAAEPHTDGGALADEVDDSDLEEMGHHEMKLAVGMMIARAADAAARREADDDSEGEDLEGRDKVKAPEEPKEHGKKDPKAKDGEAKKSKDAPASDKDDDKPK
jgi:hypothetical protein